MPVASRAVLCYSTEGMVQYLWVLTGYSVVLAGYSATARKVWCSTCGWLIALLIEARSTDRAGLCTSKCYGRCSVHRHSHSCVPMSQRIRKRPMRQCRSAATVRNGALSPGSAIRQCRTRKLTSPRMCTSAKQSLARGLVVSESSHRSDSVQTPRARRVSTRRLERGRSCSRPPSALLLSGAPNRNGVTGLPRPLDVSPY